jgi:hypothetical protein
MTSFLCEYKYFFNGVKLLRSSTTRVIGWMQWLDLILNHIPIIQKFQRTLPGKQVAFPHQPPEIPVNYSIYKNFFLTPVF